MNKPSRRPADRPEIEKAPSGHPARAPKHDDSDYPQERTSRQDRSSEAARDYEEDTPLTAPTTEAPTELPATGARAGEELVNYGGRIPKSLRQRARMYVAANELEHQDLLAAALREYLDRRGA